MIPVTVNTTHGEYNAEIPQGWHECPFEIGRWIWETNPGPADVFSRLTGVPDGWLGEMLVPDVMSALSLLSWVMDRPRIDQFARPDRIKVLESTYNLPLDLGEMTHRFHVDTEPAARSIDPEKPETVMQAIFEIVSGYLSEVVAGKYDSKHAESLADTVNSLPFGTVCGIATFFLRKKFGYWISNAIAAGQST